MPADAATGELVGTPATPPGVGCGVQAAWVRARIAGVAPLLRSQLELAIERAEVEREPA